MCRTFGNLPKSFRVLSYSAVMELDEISFLKILHSAVDKFIVCIKGYFPHEILSKDKLFCEIVKRYESITQSIRSIVLHIKTSLESSGNAYKYI